jgi:serine-type D-Ala-D-Ala carboxypeptidase/endopeptidase (penicillin-binding protein 4)
MIEGKGGKDGKDGKVAGSSVKRSMLRTLFCLCVLPLLPVLPVLPAQSLAKRLDARLDRPPFNRQLWGLALSDENGRLMYSRNADRLFMPASNTKLVVAAVASALLPPDWRPGCGRRADG